jgi:hypothetical protein
MASIKIVAGGILTLILAVIIALQIFGNMSSELSNAGTNLTYYNASDTSNVGGGNLPLSSLFGTSGIVFIIIMAMVLILVIGLVMRYKK